MSLPKLIESLRCAAGTTAMEYPRFTEEVHNLCRYAEAAEKSLTSLHEQVRKLTEERGVAESRGPMTHENCAACIRSLDSAGMGKPGAPYGNTLTGMVAEACSELTTAKQQIEELTAWKTSAIEHWPPVQEIGTVLRLPVGSDANKGILPAVEKLVDKHDALAARCAELEAEVADARTVQKQLASERATALEALAGERRRIELSKATASEVWATHEKQFADQQEKLDAANARIAELEKERDELREELDGLATTSTGEMLAEAQEREVKHLVRIAELESEAARLREARCSTCAYWQKCPTVVPGCESEMICGYSKQAAGGLNGQDGRAIITPPDFGCIHWRAAVSERDGK